MNIKPSENINLYGLDDYFNEIINLFLNKKLPNKILLSGKKGCGKSTLAYHIVNFILSEAEIDKYDLDKKSIRLPIICLKEIKIAENQAFWSFMTLDKTSCHVKAW